MTKKFRFLPLSIIVMSMVLGVKIVDFSIGVEVAFAQNNTNAAEPDASQKPAEHE